MSKMTIHFTLLISFLLLMACGAKNSGNNASSASAATAVSTPLVLVAAASADTVATGSTVSFSVIGGSGPYTWVITSGGGTLSSSTGANVIYTASNIKGLASLSVTDAVGNKGAASVNVVAATTTSPTALCSGSYSATLGSYAASFQFSTSSGGALTGSMQHAGHQYPLTGTCTASAIRFTLTETGDTFQGSFTAASSSTTRSPMSGTYFNVYYQSTQNWTATPK